MEQSVSYTVLEVVLKDFTVSQDYTDYFGDKLPIQLELDYILIDKRVTRNIKLAYMKSQSPSTDFKRFTKLTYEQIIPQVKKEMENKEYDLTTPIEYNKLIY